LKEILFTGAGTAIITPFKNNQIDYDSYKKILDKQIEEKVGAIVVCGTTGESATLNDTEHKELISFTVEYVNKRIPVIAGTGSNDTPYAVELSKFACDAGADGLLSVTPYYNKTTQKGLIKHYLAVAEAVDKPIILYNVPSRTGVNILPETCFELSKHPNINGLKNATSNPSQILKTVALCGDELNIYSGDDDQITTHMAIGAKGVISVLSNLLPGETQRICTEFINGNVAESLRLQIKYLDLINALFCEVNPMPVKKAMALCGYCSDEIRLPLCELEEANEAKLCAILKKHGLIA